MKEKILFFKKKRIQKLKYKKDTKKEEKRIKDYKNALVGENICKTILTSISLFIVVIFFMSEWDHNAFNNIKESINSNENKIFELYNLYNDTKTSEKDKKLYEKAMEEISKQNKELKEKYEKQMGDLVNFIRWATLVSVIVIGIVLFFYIKFLEKRVKYEK